MFRLLPLLLLLAASPARADLVYVLNSGEASVTLLDAASRQEVRKLPVLREPHHLVLTPDGRHLVIADSSGNELLFIDPPTGEIQRRERISNPYHLEYSPDGKLLVIASLRRNQVDIYDATTLTLLQRLRPGDKPSHIAFSPDSRFAYVTLQGASGLAAIDLERREIAWTADVGPEPAGVTWHRGKLVVGIMGTDYFVAVDAQTQKVERAFVIGRGAHTVFPAPDGRALYATSRVDSRVAEIDPETLTVRRVWDLPGGPDCVSFDPDGKLWITLRWVGRVAIFDPVTGTAETVRVGRSPHGIFVKSRREDVLAGIATGMPGEGSGTRPRPAPPPPVAAPVPPPPEPVATTPAEAPAPRPAFQRRAR